MVTFINDYDPRLRDPGEVRATASTVQSLDACDNHRCLVTLRRCGVSLSTPKAHDAKVFSRLTNVDPELPKALNRLLAKLIRLGNPEGGSAPIPTQDQSHYSFSSNTCLAAASRQTDHSSTSSCPGCEQKAYTCEDFLLIVVKRWQADGAADGQFCFSASTHRRCKLDREPNIQNESSGWLASPAFMWRKALEFKRITQPAQQRRPVYREREQSNILCIQLVSHCLAGSRGQYLEK